MGRRSRHPKPKKKRGGGGGGGGERSAGGGGAPSAAGATPDTPPSSPPPRAPDDPRRDDTNFVRDAGRGCHIVRLDDSHPPPPPWALGVEPYDPSEYDPGVPVPDVSIDPTAESLSATNASDASRVYYLSVYDVRTYGRGGEELDSGTTTDDGGETRVCTTFVVVCPPRTFVHLCTIRSPPGGGGLGGVRIESDVSDWDPHPDPDDGHPLALGFPLGYDDRDEGEAHGADSASSIDGGGGSERRGGGRRGRGGGRGFLCTQGEGGHLTHFLRGNHHSYDFRCPIGTPVLAAGDGTVAYVRDGCRRSGVGVSNLYGWNSVMIELDVEEEGQDGGGSGAEGAEGAARILDDGGPGPASGEEEDGAYAARLRWRSGPLYVEYVHVSPGSALVAPGDRVRRGRVICLSGSAGFSPEPHLHVSAYRSDDDAAPTVGFRFRSERTGSAYSPRAGVRYDADGPVEA